MSDLRPELVPRALQQIRDALVTLHYADEGWYEDEAQVALDALDYLESLDTLQPATHTQERR